MATVQAIHNLRAIVQKGANADNGPPGKRMKLATTTAAVSYCNHTHTPCTHHPPHRLRPPLRDITTRPRSLPTTRHVTGDTARPTPPPHVTTCHSTDDTELVHVWPGVCCEFIKNDKFFFSTP